MASSSQNSHRIYPYFKDGRFYNYLGEKQEGMIRSGFMILESLLQKTRGLRRLKQQWNSSVQSSLPIARRISSDPLVTWVGHATFLINISGLNILTDPIFDSPSIFFPRMTAPGLSLEQMPSIDIVLISHNHRDHLNEPALKELYKKNAQMKLLVPLGDKQWLQHRGFANVEEYTWWDNGTIVGAGGEKVIFTFLPAIHWSGRGVFDRNKSLWGSWMIQSSGHNLYFAGDTAYGRHFKAIATEFGQIDTVLMPIGPCEPHEDLQLTHVNAEQAGQAFLELGAQQFIPMHWGVFWFGTDYPLLPVERLQTWCTKNKEPLEGKLITPLKFCESVACKRVSDRSVIHDHIVGHKHI